jgi:predicted dehydrogenase
MFDMSLVHINRVKIIGAGSIGNHLAHAGRRLNCEVTVCDVSHDALRRMRDEIYPSRYGAWDDAIALHTMEDMPRGGFDLICIGTPPEFHVQLALEALDEGPRALQIEKPLCTPDLRGAAELAAAAAHGGTSVFVGYDHVVGDAAGILHNVLRDGRIGEVTTFDVEFREHWGGIFRAHPWLSGPADSYLGFWKRGGGASGEHSHAMNFWQHLSHIIGAGRVVEVSALVRYVERDGAEFDDCCFCLVKTDTGMVGRIVQDVVTQPVKKEAVIAGTLGVARWINGYTPRSDAVIISRVGEPEEVLEVPKSRPDDFIRELRHIDASLVAGAPPSPLALERGLDTMLLISAAHRSAQTGRAVHIEYAPTSGVGALV